MTSTSMRLPPKVPARQFDMVSLVPLIAALVPLLITPGVLAYFDVTPKIAILLSGVALMLLQVGANSCNVRVLWGATSGRWLVGLLTVEWVVFAIASWLS